MGRDSYEIAKTAYLEAETVTRTSGTTKRRTLYEEVWECRFPRRQTVEEELLTLQALTPDHVGLGLDFHFLFKEAVNNSLVNILDENEARALVILIAGTDFESPQSVFAALDSILHEGSHILKDAIVEEFRISVQMLSEKVERGLSAGHEQNGSDERLPELEYASR